MLILDNRDAERALCMVDCIEALEHAYKELAVDRAGNIPRADMIVPTEIEGRVYAFKSMAGTFMRGGITALRINSDIVHWPLVNGVPRRVKIPLAPGNRYVGLIMLFSNSTGELLAMFPNGIVQRLRVGGASGLAAKYLARPDARAVGILGSGWQAGAHVMAMCAVRSVEVIKVYSPNEEHRRAFAEEMMERTGVEAVPVASPQDAASEVDILIAATNSMRQVVSAEWVKPGMHVTCVRAHEIDPAIYEDETVKVVVNSHESVHHYLVGGLKSIPELSESWAQPALQTISWSRFPELADVVAGKAGKRMGPYEKTCFCNNIGLGVQFAAVGLVLYQKARQLGLGRELPTEWFTELEHP